MRSMIGLIVCFATLAVLDPGNRNTSNSPHVTLVTAGFLDRALLRPGGRIVEHLLNPRCERGQATRIGKLGHRRPGSLEADGRAT